MLRIEEGHLVPSKLPQSGQCCPLAGWPGPHAIALGIQRVEVFSRVPQRAQALSPDRMPVAGPHCAFWGGSPRCTSALRNQHLAGERRWTLGVNREQVRSQARPLAAAPCGRPSSCWVGPAVGPRSLALPAAVAARGESLAFTVLVSNFLLLSILFRENNVLNKALASSAGAHPTAGRWPLREDNGPAGRWCLVPVLRESGHSGIWRPVRIPASLLFHPWALEASSPQSH